MRARLEAKREDVRGWVLPAAILSVLVAGATLDLRCAPAGLDEPARAWLTAYVAPAIGPGDFVFVAPPSSASEVAAALGRPVYAGYPETVPSPIDGAPRTLWWVTAQGARLPQEDPWDTLDREAIASGEGWDVERTTPSGAAPIRYDFWSDLDGAQAAVVHGEDARPCERESEARFRCGPDDWNFVGRYVGDVASARRRCIWAHPVSGATVVLRFPATPLGPGAVIRGGVGILDGTPDGAPVQLRVLVDGEQRARQTVPGKAGTWRPFSVPSKGGTTHGAAASAPGPSEVAFEITADDNRWRLLCLDAVVVGPPPKANPRSSAGAREEGR